MMSQAGRTVLKLTFNYLKFYKILSTTFQFTSELNCAKKPSGLNNAHLCYSLREENEFYLAYDIVNVSKYIAIYLQEKLTIMYCSLLC